MTAQVEQRRSAEDALRWLQQCASNAYLDVTAEWHALPDGPEKEAAWKLVGANLDALHALRDFRPEKQR